MNIKNQYVLFWISCFLRGFATSILLKESLLKSKHAIRYQEFTPLGKYLFKGNANITVPFITFKIMDYNILSHTHMNAHIRNYKKCPRECLNWSYRKTILREELLAENIDIFCLQEVESDHKDTFLEPFRKMGYDALYVPRAHGKPDGCALLYRTDMFKISDFKPINYFRPEVPLLDRPNVGLVARLSLRAHPQQQLVVANTHLLYNQRRVDIKLSQLQILLAETDRMARAGPDKYHPVILTGDLNVNAASPLIRLLSHGSVDVRLLDRGGGRPLPPSLLLDGLSINQMCHYERGAETTYKENSHEKEDWKDSNSNKRLPPTIIAHSFPFINVYDHPQMESKSQHSLTSDNKKFNVYDYMFYSCNARAQTSIPPFLLRTGQLQLLSRLRMPTTSEFNSHIKYLPNYACGSDHLPLAASFLLPL